MSEENKQELKPCRVCKKQMDMNNKNAYITGMAGSMHFYVCSSGCLSEYYIPKNNTRADSKPEVEDMKHQLLDSEWKNGLLETKVERLRTALSNADEEIIVLSDQRNDAMAYVTSLKAEAERLKAESKANYRLLKSAVAKRSEDRKERDEYKLLLTKLVRCVETYGSSGDEYNSALVDANEALSETGGNHNE